MNVGDLKQKILNDQINIIKILESIDCHKIRFYKDQVRCSYNEFSNPSSIQIDLNDSLKCISYSSEFSFNGDIISLVEAKLKVRFLDAIKHICKILNIDAKNIKQTKKTCAFGGYYKNLTGLSCNVAELTTYPENTLLSYKKMSNKRFLKDGISLETQKKFNTMYDLDSNRIVIPYLTEEGLVGITGRYNGDDFEELGIPKYLALLSFSKSKCLYGLSENYSDITNNRIIIGEAEKSVMQLDTMGIKNGVSVGCHNISDTQINIIKSLFCNEIIIAFDEGISSDILEQECRKVQYTSPFLKTKVGYIYDAENKYIPKGSKASPTDFGKQIFEKLIKECVVWI